MRSRSTSVLLAVAAFAAGCGRAPEPMKSAVAMDAPPVAPRPVAPRHEVVASQPTPEPRGPAQAPTALHVESMAFEEGGSIPIKYTSDGENVSPPLEWSAGPIGTQFYALIVDDPDSQAGTWTHWVLWNEAGVRLPEDVRPAIQIPDGAMQGKNSWQKQGYGGPQPPAGTEHRYFFRVFALDARIELSPDAGKTELEAAMQGHVLAQGELMGRYAAKTPATK
jgi:Raf kinase inhibitor-like YbhB/YbcL family protein